MSSMASISSSSSATVRVDKATSEFLSGPDWTMNIDICDTINSNQMLAKDVVKAVKKRLQHKNPKVQLLALTLLETMVKNCGDYVHFQIAERNILQEMVKIVKKKTDMHVREKILTLIGSWHEAFGGSGGRYPQYYMAYEDLRRSGVEFPRDPPNAAPILTPVTHPISRHPHPGGIPSSSSTMLDEVMLPGNLSLSIINSMCGVVDLLNDMLQAVDPSDRSAVNDELIVDLVERCRANQRKLMQMLATTGDEQLLGHGLELNDSLQSVLGKHDAITSGSPLPPQVTNVKPEAVEKHDSSLKLAEVVTPNATSNSDPSAPALPAHRGLIDEEEDEEDDFAQLARRHSKARIDASHSTSVTNSNDLTLSKTSNNAATSEANPTHVMSNALVVTNTPAPVGTKDQDIIDLLSITLSTATSAEQTYQTPTSPVHGIPQGHVPTTSPGITFSSEAYPGNHGLAFIYYKAPWAQPEPGPQVQSQSEHLHHPQPQPQPQTQPPYVSQPASHSQHSASLQQPRLMPHTKSQLLSQPEVQPQPEQQTHCQPQSLYAEQSALQPPHPQPQFLQFSSGYPPPPWAATPGYFRNPSTVSYTYSTPRPASSIPRPLQRESINGETLVNSSPRSAAPNAGQKPFIPSYRLFEDLNVFDGGRFKAATNASPNLSGSNNHSMGGRK
ncbi:hypothetical protein Pfo_004505 [Paulownia fortunei]|nr:hypothetical protein Pfo_004505 [Paulownia fortunei]